jgi:hypothetical protein
MMIFLSLWWLVLLDDEGAGLNMEDVWTRKKQAEFISVSPEDDLVSQAITELRPRRIAGILRNELSIFWY